MKPEHLIFKRRIRRIGPKIDIGCKKNVVQGFIGLDVVDFGQDIVWDVGEGLPFPDNSLTDVHMSHFVEHLSREESCILFGELLRVCRPGAVIGIACPHADTKEAWYHTHASNWSEKRVVGLVEGYAGSQPKGGKCFVTEKLERSGMELRARLKVITK